MFWGKEGSQFTYVMFPWSFIFSVVASAFYVAGGHLLSREPLLFFSLLKTSLKYSTGVREKIWGSNYFLQIFKYASCSQFLPQLHFQTHGLCPVAILPGKRSGCFLAFPTALSVAMQSPRSAKTVTSHTDAFQVPTLCYCYLSSCSPWPCRLRPKNPPKLKNAPPSPS